MNKRSFYDKISNTYAHDFDRCTDRFGFEELMKLLPNIKNKTILDYGCGPGEFSKMLAKRRGIVTGTDISEEMLKLAKQKSQKNLNFKTIEDALKTNYDFCTCSFVLPCIESEENMKIIFSNINNHLNYEGKLLILTPNPLGIGHQYLSFSMNYPEKLCDGCEIEYTLKGINDKFKETWWSNEMIISILQKSNFFDINIYEPIPPENGKWLDERIQAPFVIFEAYK